MDISVQLKALTSIIYKTAKLRLNMANADPIVSEIVMENVLSKFRDDAYTSLALDTIANEAPPKSEVKNKDEQLADKSEG